MPPLTSNRLPLGEVSLKRYQKLGSIKNVQNSIYINEGGKAPLQSPKRRLAEISIAEDVSDFENMSPSKRAKGSLDIIPKALKVVEPKPKALSSAQGGRPSAMGARPKHQRIGALSKVRRNSGLRKFSVLSDESSSIPPFSLQAALGGAKDKPEVVEMNTGTKDPIPDSWIFEIYEDTPQEEATNLMEHSTAVLEISTSTPDAFTEANKENLPPPGFNGPAGTSCGQVHPGISSVVRKAAAAEAMVEDRAPLGDLETASFYPDGLDENSVEVPKGDDRLIFGKSVLPLEPIQETESSVDTKATAA
ncbi:hypothetical protein EJ06DRAFT_318879 [Trichodelitschia bisporula]|uniref:Uncharacterized protein n=1 Tax=Trichodelitschia bisporula TaxID=703511 RepID=A0A6G1I4S4_9PEZI|nr:hypothetical protein EJ06DRAFT_318879 [Trichodelitschia bisporula]